MGYRKLTLVVLAILFSFNIKAQVSRDTLLIGAINLHPPHDKSNHEGAPTGFSVEQIERIQTSNNNKTSNNTYIDKWKTPFALIIIFFIITLISFNHLLKKKIHKRTQALKRSLDIAKKAQQEAENSNKLKSIFLSNMSHEIRTPLNSICGFSNLLSEGDITKEDKQHYAKIINNNSEQLTTLISDIIDVSKIEANQIEIHTSSFNINEMLSDIHKKFLLEKKRRERFNVNIRFESPLFDSISNIISDKNRVNQIISNLIGNALKFTESGEICFGYTLIKKQNKDFIQFYIKDTGIGIKQENLKSIFERYKQTESQFTHLGTGLGLSICQKLTDMLGGNIWVESEYGRGTTFLFTIPYIKTETAQHSLNNKITEHHKWSNKSIVFVFDHKENKNFVISLLNPTGINKIAFDSQIKAIDYVKMNKSNIDLVLVDLNLPVSLGIEASRQIKELDPKMPIVGLCSATISHESDIFTMSTCDDYINTAEKTNEFYNILNLWLNK